MKTTTCDACGRASQRTERQVVQGHEIQLCVDPTDCRMHWPIEDQRAVARFVRDGAR